MNGKDAKNGKHEPQQAYTSSPQPQNFFLLPPSSNTISPKYMHITTLSIKSLSLSHFLESAMASVYPHLYAGLDCQIHTPYKDCS